ncbi:hypothetical protein BP6252_00203 [Coleophoma cylindrospora]|uniref:Uncharacterized protein n=1 Tax=Coleophoma cylindrospora TaxID=1849047 RepID=A0A3D8SPR8_9HELO|nr:hypothetical protein BP6252_00203 [Coleophoma cylindrospora]
MSGNGIEVYKPTTPIRPRHQVSRSITETGSFHRHHRPHHHHTNRHHEKAPQSAHPNLQSNSLADGIKSEGVTPDHSRNASRRTSMLVEGADVSTASNARKVEPEKDVREEKEKVAQRATQLRNVLMDLNSQSNNNTRRLDNTYYSVLEKLSALQSTIQNMKELATMTRKLDAEFKTESTEFVKDVETQLDGFDGFRQQQKRIEDLDERVKKGRQRIKRLAERVDVVGDRVESWERMELEWQDRTRKRLKLLWILMSICAGILVVLVVFQYTPARTQGPRMPHGLNTSNLAGQIQNETANIKKAAARALEGLRNKTQDEESGSLPEDPRLRLFDEL